MAQVSTKVQVLAGRKPGDVLRLSARTSAMRTWTPNGVPFWTNAVTQAAAGRAGGSTGAAGGAETPTAARTTAPQRAIRTRPLTVRHLPPLRAIPSHRPDGPQC